MRNESPKEKMIALLLCLFFGAFGLHRLYAGRPGTAVLQFITLGGLGIWALIDFVRIFLGNFEDGQGKVIAD